MRRLLGLFLLLGFTSLFAFEHLTSSNFDEKIRGKKVIIDFYATWCPPCKIIAKNLIEYDEIKPKDVTIYKVDIDKQKVLMKRFGIRSIPTIIYMKNGQILSKEVGVKSFSQIQRSVNKYLINK